MHAIRPTHCQMDRTLIRPLRQPKLPFQIVVLKIHPPDAPNLHLATGLIHTGGQERGLALPLNQQRQVKDGQSASKLRRCVKRKPAQPLVI